MAVCSLTLTLAVLLFYIYIPIFAYKTQFRFNDVGSPTYNPTVAPSQSITSYESVIYANMTVKINQPIQDGPGANLVTDPDDPTKSLYVGNTINRQAFDTQFVLDIEYALGINRNRVYVTHVAKGKNHFTWEYSSVIVQFILLERNDSSSITLLETISTLTNMIQTNNSAIYNGNVTKDIDYSYGLVVRTWDVSLKLSYAIENVGGDAVIDGYFLNQGGLGRCATEEALNYEYYCEFERFFEDDIANALDIPSYRIQIMFVKKAAVDSVIIFFRIFPQQRNTNDKSIETCISELHDQIKDLSSQLYKGNVTIRVDPTWGLSESNQIKRTSAAIFTQKYYELDSTKLKNKKRMSLFTGYDRCKANRRCNWGLAFQNQSTNDVRYFHQLFDNGQQNEVNLFLDFEDWRLGSRGLMYTNTIPPIMSGQSTMTNVRSTDGYINGAHFSPFEQHTIGPTIPAYIVETNQGLVLDHSLHITQVEKQAAFISDIEGRLNWTIENSEWARMDANRRARIDVKNFMQLEVNQLSHWLGNEQLEMSHLNSSQCIYNECSLLFNTSSLQLTGVISGTGELKTTSSGTEVAVFTFNSVYLGPEVSITVVGQRALSLVSRTTFILNTTIVSTSGTLGGFPGGGSTSRLEDDRLSDHPTVVLICELGDYCSNRHNSSSASPLYYTTNVNGPGSGSLVITTFVIKTSAEYSPEIQMISTIAASGQTLYGGFQLKYKDFITSIIPHDVTSSLLKQIIEMDLNTFTPESSLISIDRTAGVTALTSDLVAGVGNVIVSRSISSEVEGYNWTITFTSAVGNIAQLEVISHLYSVDAAASVATIQDGNDIDGYFQLTIDDETTEDIRHNVTSVELEVILNKLSTVSSASVIRNNPILTDETLAAGDVIGTYPGTCDDGSCSNGPLPSHGYIWTVLITNNQTNMTTSPTQALQYSSNDDTPVVSITSYLTGRNVTIDFTYGTSRSTDDIAKELKLNTSFSLAYGGGGGSYGGYGGGGYGTNPPSHPYNDLKLTDLLGGSGGSMKTASVYDINRLGMSVNNSLERIFIAGGIGQGGSGGGAIEIIASNDIHIGSYGKILMTGGHGEQSSEGGGGGGSGGAILIATGGMALIEGVLDVHGGDGGYGGELSGGGGSGGRIAIYGQSVTTLNSTINVSGGHCGRRTVRDATGVIFTYHSIFVLSSYLPLYGKQMYDIALSFLMQSLNTTSISPLMHFDETTYTRHGVLQNVSIADESHYYSQENYITQLELSIHIIPSLLTTKIHLNANESYYDLHHNITALERYLTKLMSPFIDQSIASVRLTDHHIRVNHSSISISYNLSSYSYPVTCSNSGGKGTYYSQAYIQSSVFVHETNAAESTSKALYISNRESDQTTSGSYREVEYSWNGPLVNFEPCNPTRVTFYTRVSSSSLVSSDTVSTRSNFGSLFSLITRGEAGLNVSNVIGIFFGSKIMHGANFGSAVDEKIFLKRLVTLDEYPTANRWYKFDIFLQWSSKTYSVSIDDTKIVTGQSFTGSDIDGIRLSVSRSIDVWYDEIYVGFDNTMSFVCPTSTRKGTQTVQPVQRAWSFDEVHGGNSNGYTEYYQMVRHYSFMDTTGSLPFDGNGDVKDNQDIKLKYTNGDFPPLQGYLHAGALLYVTDSLRSGKTPTGRSSTLVSPNGLWYQPPDGNVQGGAGDGRYFLYIEYDHSSNISSTLNGGVAACSSQDLTTWRFEGIVFHYTNLSDMVYGSDGPFYVERPKVKWNTATGQYVMWAVMDNHNRSYAMSATMSSPYEDGPFYFRRSFYPDGNRTRDQVIFFNDETNAVLGRTYYLTVEYVLPESIMQPIWESVKDLDGNVNYRANYHRAWYDVGYDNYNDIYLQRWTKEDQPWNVTCVNKITGAVRDVAYGIYTEKDTICYEPEEYKVVYGQGQPTVSSKFVDPTDELYSFWKPSSVPAVVSQPWGNNYVDGYCGIRKLNDDFDNENDPELSSFSPTDRSTCSNIADNPIFTTQEDKLIGVLRVVNTRRAKYMAISELTSDYMDTTGALSSIEGELTSGYLISMIIEMGQFGLQSGENISSTFLPPIRPDEFDTANDYKTRFRQYIHNYNDRALYSLACVLDGNCPVNFQDQIQ